MPPALAENLDFKRFPETRKTLDRRVLRITRKTLATFAKQAPGEQSPGVLLSSGLLEVKLGPEETKNAPRGGGQASLRARLIQEDWVLVAGRVAEALTEPGSPPPPPAPRAQRCPARPRMPPGSCAGAGPAACAAWPQLIWRRPAPA